jgi:F-type H+/Na+-transporting ATPase subunit beta
VELFLTQPFFSTRGENGRYVPLKETIAGFHAILTGACDEWPEEAFFEKGDLNEVQVHSKRLTS